MHKRIGWNKVAAACAGAAMVAGAAGAELIAFQAEDYVAVTGGTVGTIGSFSDAEATVHNPFGTAIYESGYVSGSDSPDATVTYSVFLPVGTYDLYARVFVPTTDDLTDSANPNNQSRFSNDSFYVPTGFDTAPTANFNALANAAERQFAWVNAVDGGNLLTGATGSPFVVTVAGIQTLQITTRENGLLIDAFAFGSADQTYTAEELNAAIPEPASLALMGLGGLALLRRRQA